MKEFLLYASVVAVIGLAGLWAFSSSFRTKGRALSDVGGTLVSADCNYGPVVDCGGVVLRAKHNLNVVTRAADYLVAVGGNTKVFMEIARIAADAEAECPRLNEVLDLAVMKRSESMHVLALARSACRLQTEEQIAQWQRVYDELAASAEYTSVEAGLESRKRN